MCACVSAALIALCAACAVVVGIHPPPLRRLRAVGRGSWYWDDGVEAARIKRSVIGAHEEYVLPRSWLVVAHINGVIGSVLLSLTLSCCGDWKRRLSEGFSSGLFLGGT